MSIVQVLKVLVPDIALKHVYEMSSRGPLFEFLKSHCRYLTVSEYFDGVLPGAFKDGVQCQDVHQLTYPDECFNICTSTEVFEHVADDLKGFAEIHRVLRPGSLFIFTVPLSNSATTVQRAELVDGEIRHLLPPEYHSDLIRGEEKVLVYRDFGLDITERLRQAGFGSARIMKVDDSEWWGLGQSVVVAEK
jgi:SAM-dependent methyltransferase